MKTTITILAFCLLHIGFSHAQEKSDSLGNQYVKQMKEIYLLQVEFQNTSEEQLKVELAKQIKEAEKKSLLIHTQWKDELCRDNLRNVLGGETANYNDCELIGVFIEKLMQEINEDQWLCASLIHGDCKDFFERKAESLECESIRENLRFLISLFNNKIKITPKKPDVRI
jgi:hypothetical protein